LPSDVEGLIDGAHPSTTEARDNLAKATRSGSRQERAPYRRKLIGFDEETWQALDLLGRDTMKDVQELADEAFADLLKKHQRPVTLSAALKQSLRAGHAPRPKTKR
jgi:hypothetical protein